MPPALIAVAAFAAFAGFSRTTGVHKAAFALLFGATLGGSSVAQTLRLRPAGLPQVNLAVSWRVDAGGSQRSEQRVVTGQVIVDSRGVVVGRTGLGATTVQTETDTRSAQMLQVLNGQQARLFVGQQVGRQSWQLLWSPQGGAGTGSGAGAGGTVSGTAAAAAGTNMGSYGIQSQTTWVDLGDGLTVRPRWAGGRQPVLLDVEARSSRALNGAQAGGGFEADGQVGRTEVASTLSLPLNQWTVLARSGGSTHRDGGTTLSTRSLDEQGSQTLWVRVSLTTPGSEPDAEPSR